MSGVYIHTYVSIPVPEDVMCSGACDILFITALVYFICILLLNNCLLMYHLSNSTKQKILKCNLPSIICQSP